LMSLRSDSLICGARGRSLSHGAALPRKLDGQFPVERPVPLATIDLTIGNLALPSAMSGVEDCSHADGRAPQGKLVAGPSLAPRVVQGHGRTL
jgi:hypothetical protein